LNLASVLIKKIIADRDVDTWASLQKHYLPEEFSRVHSVIESHVDEFSTLPSFDDLKLSVRDRRTLEKIFVIEKSEYIDVPASQLLEYLKNEYTQAEIMSQLEKYLETSVAIDNAEESLSNLQAIVLDIESKVDLKTPENDMRRIDLFYSEEELAKNVPLSLNGEYDLNMKFSPRDLILIGGRRGAGKSLTCANIAANIFEEDKSVMYFTIEMDARSILQRICAIATNVNMAAIRNKSLSLAEWRRIAGWWAKRFEEGEVAYNDYLEHNSFDKFHSQLIRKPLKDVQLDVVYDPDLSISKIRSEIDKKVMSISPRAIIVDYLNQIKYRTGTQYSKFGQYDWTEQIEISKALKSMAQQYEIPIIAPYQIDASGEARFAKGILDAADAAFTLDTHSPDDGCITFNCVKMRNGEVRGFTSAVDWKTLKIGPESAKNPADKNAKEGTGESVYDDQ
jgi:hypothetical protein